MPINKPINKTVLYAITLAVVFLLFVEILLMGSGNITRFSVFGISFTLRMVLFSISFVLLAVQCLFYKKRTIHPSYIIAFALAFLSIVSSVVVGFCYKNSGAAIWHDVKKYLTILIFPLIILSGITKDEKYLNILKRSAEIIALVISIFSLFIYFSTNFWGLDTYSFFHNILPRYEIIKRANGGGIYFPSQITVFIVLIVQLYYLLIRRRKSTFLLASVTINFSCIFQTSTRSFLYVLLPYMLILCIFYLLTIIKDATNVWSWIVLFSIVFIFFFMFRSAGFNRTLSSIEPGSGQRESYIKEILGSFSFFGKGFGSSLVSRGTSDLEIPLLEIYYEQGLLGLLCWSCSFFIYIKEMTKSKKECIPYLCGVFALLIASLANPYFLTPMGWFCVIWLFVFATKPSFFPMKIE